MTRTAMILLSATLVLAACDKLPGPDGESTAAPAPAPTVAVLDVDAVAKALGRDEVFKQQVQAAGRQLQQQLSEFSSGLEGKLKEEQARLGAEPSQEERQQLARMAVDAQRQIQQGQTLARQKALAYQTKLAAEFRAEIQPVVSEVALGRGASAVLVSSTLLWFEPSANITGAVIDALRARGANAGAPTLAPASSQEPEKAD